MKLSIIRRSLSLLTFLSIASAEAQTTDPRTNSWFTTYSGKYARIYQTSSDQTAGTSVTTWSRGAGVQSVPAYNGVQEIYSSTNWVYIRSSGLGVHVMGPWYLDLQKTQLFPNYPANSKTFYRIPRTPSVPTTKTLTGLGAIGYFVDGVAMFDTEDSYIWNGTVETNRGTGYWFRDAYVNEGPSFDPNNAHQEQTGMYHYHANPPALRYLLGDNVLFNSAAKTYSENTNNATLKHSPILGWVRDGYPIYGPYGYSTATNAASGVRRMISGFALRNGQNGTDNLATTGRTGIPAWASRIYNVATNQTGPGVSTQYPIGHYMEDNAYLGDIGKTQGVNFDLDEYNGRYCVTPEFPNGTYAYFVSITAAGAPNFPYNIGRAFYGDPTGASVTTLAETVVTNFVGGGSVPATVAKPTRNANTVTLTWSTAEGGTYAVQSSTNLSTWNNKATNILAAGVSAQTNFTGDTTKEFYRVARTALATNESVYSTAGNGITSVSPTSGTRGSTVTLTINLNSSSNPPPQTAPINSITVGTISGTSLTHVSQTQVQASITIPAGATTGAQTVSVTFPGPPETPTNTVTFTLPSGFTIQ